MIKYVLGLCSSLILFTYRANEKLINTRIQKPNIIYIMADDLGYGELGAYGQEKIETPNIDALAKGGMLFKQFYSGAPVCAPARAILMTGKHSGHNYIRGNDEWRDRGMVWDYMAMNNDSTLEGQRPLPANTITFAKLLQEQGYTNAIVGKWGLGAPHTESIPNNMGFDYFFGYNCQRQAHTLYPQHLYENKARFYLKNKAIAPNTGMDEDLDSLDINSYKDYTLDEYAETVMVEKMMTFVEKNKNKPFFLYWASPLPHLPLQAPKKWVDYYVNKFGDEKPYVFRKGKSGGYFPTRYPRATYAAMISYLDENVGKLVAYLKKEKLLDNTMIIFTSDNGPSFTGGCDPQFFDSAKPFDSQYGKGKGFVHEGGIRVPFIVHWPTKVKAGATSDHVGAFWDIFPTMLEIANIKKDVTTDGISILPSMTGKSAQKKHDYLYWEFPEYGGQVAIRKDNFKMIWREIHSGNKTIEVFDLETDIKEQDNIANQHPELVSFFFETIKKEHATPSIEKFIIKAVEDLCKS
ncbi:MAG TPA: arylsulfatase [Saprospiraceae bacterium]|nr:arylsulfatase [Saprospiraceae bacterium]